MDDSRQRQSCRPHFRQPGNRPVPVAAAAALLLVCIGGCNPDGNADSRANGAMDGMPGHSMEATLDTAGLRTLEVPPEHREGEALFEETCAVCHGEAALGTAQGPPLVHPVYEPNHHADISFIFAAERGVRAHHWRFGDMPPQPGVSREGVMAIVGYVRWLQREAGIY